MKAELIYYPWETCLDAGYILRNVSCISFWRTDRLHVWGRAPLWSFLDSIYHPASRSQLVPLTWSSPSYLETLSTSNSFFSSPPSCVFVTSSIVKKRNWERPKNTRSVFNFVSCPDRTQPYWREEGPPTSHYPDLKPWQTPAVSVLLCCSSAVLKIVIINIYTELTKSETEGWSSINSPTKSRLLDPALSGLRCSFQCQFSGRRKPQKGPKNK